MLSALLTPPSLMPPSATPLPVTQRWLPGLQTAPQSAVFAPASLVPVKHTALLAHWEPALQRPEVQVVLVVPPSCSHLLSPSLHCEMQAPGRLPSAGKSTPKVPTFEVS